MSRHLDARDFNIERFRRFARLIAAALAWSLTASSTLLLSWVNTAPSDISMRSASPRPSLAPQVGPQRSAPA
jgi:hypothetical protein